jgi:hypothetical protein
LRISAQHRQTVAHAIPIARDLIQFALPVHMILSGLDFFAHVAALLSARLPVAPPAWSRALDWPKTAAPSGRTANFSSISVLARRLKLTGL